MMNLTQLIRWQGDSNAFFIHRGGHAGAVAHHRTHRALKRIFPRAEVHAVFAAAAMPVAVTCACRPGSWSGSSSPWVCFVATATDRSSSGCNPSAARARQGVRPSAKLRNASARAAASVGRTGRAIALPSPYESPRICSRMASFQPAWRRFLSMPSLSVLSWRSKVTIQRRSTARFAGASSVRRGCDPRRRTYPAPSAARSQSPSGPGWLFPGSGRPRASC